MSPKTSAKEKGLYFIQFKFMSQNGQKYGRTEEKP